MRFACRGYWDPTRRLQIQSTTIIALRSNRRDSRQGEKSGLAADPDRHARFVERAEIGSRAHQRRRWQTRSLRARRERGGISARCETRRHQSEHRHRWTPRLDARPPRILPRSSRAIRFSPTGKNFRRGVRKLYCAQKREAGLGRETRRNSHQLEKSSVSLRLAISSSGRARAPDFAIDFVQRAGLVLTRDLHSPRASEDVGRRITRRSRSRNFGRSRAGGGHRRRDRILFRPEIWLAPAKNARRGHFCSAQFFRHDFCGSNSRRKSVESFRASRTEICAEPDLFRGWRSFERGRRAKCKAWKPRLNSTARSY